jgi:neural Wiskott-Aldrich syndrome protein
MSAPPIPPPMGRAGLGPPPAPPAPGAKRVGPELAPPMPGHVSRNVAPPPASSVAGFSAPGRQLFIRYQGQLFPVNKDRFVIGRGKQSSDLTIKDPNVSRQHAMVEFSGGQYFVVDLGSTNGIEHQGQRVQRKAITDGDVIRICDHELSFSLR